MQITYNQSLLSVPTILCAFDYVDSRKEEALRPNLPELSFPRNSKEFNKISFSFQKCARIKFILGPRDLINTLRTTEAMEAQNSKLQTKFV